MSQECAICLTEIVSGSCELSCKHVFHSECMFRAFIEDRRCPLCRDTIVNSPSTGPVTMSSLIDEYEDEYQRRSRERNNYMARRRRMIRRSSFLTKLQHEIDEINREYRTECRNLKGRMRDLYNKHVMNDSSVKEMRCSQNRRRSRIRSLETRMNSRVQTILGDAPPSATFVFTL